jgi:hypothetical protein
MAPVVLVHGTPRCTPGCRGHAGWEALVYRIATGKYLSTMPIGYNLASTKIELFSKLLVKR